MRPDFRVHPNQVAAGMNSGMGHGRSRQCALFVCFSFAWEANRCLGSDPEWSKFPHLAPATKPAAPSSERPASPLVSDKSIVPVVTADPLRLPVASRACGIALP